MDDVLLEALMRVVEVRRALHPKTSYATGGSAANTLYVFDSIGSRDKNDAVTDMITRHGEFDRCVIITNALDESNFRDINNHVILSLEPNELFLTTITRMMTSRKCNLVFIISSSLFGFDKFVSDLAISGVSTRRETFSAGGALGLLVCHRSRALGAQKVSSLGSKGQPNVQLKGQFRYLWNNAALLGDAKARVLQRLADRKLKDGKTKLSISDWDRIISDRLNSDSSVDDHVIYSMLREKYVGTKLDDLRRDLMSSASTNIESDKSKKKNDEEGTGGEDAGGDGRALFMVKNLVECIPLSLMNQDNHSSSSTSHKSRIRALLDYGCAEGAITAQLAQELGIPGDSAYGADVRSISGAGFTFIQLRAEEELNSTTEEDACVRDGAKGRDCTVTDMLLPALERGSIDLVTASMVLHHVKDVIRALKELRRIISPTGALVIREHSCEGVGDAIFLDITHGLYSLSWSDPIEWPAFLEEYEAWYRSREEWNAIIEGAGFMRCVPVMSATTLHTDSRRRSNIHVVSDTRIPALHSDLRPEAQRHYDASSNSHPRRPGSRLPNLIKAYYATYKPGPDALPESRKRPTALSSSQSSAESDSRASKRPALLSSADTVVGDKKVVISSNSSSDDNTVAVLENANGMTIHESGKYPGKFYVLDDKGQSRWIPSVSLTIKEEIESNGRLIFGTFVDPESGTRKTITRVCYASPNG